MTTPRMPSSIVAVILISGALAVLAGLMAIGAYDSGEDAAVFLGALTLLAGVAGAVGTWRRWSVGRFLALTAAVLAVFAGLSTSELVLLALGVLLIPVAVIPESARAWYR